jgi:hypothetical protein
LVIVAPSYSRYGTKSWLIIERWSATSLRDAIAGWRKFVSCVATLPADQAAPLWKWFTKQRWLPMSRLKRIKMRRVAVPPNQLKAEAERLRQIASDDPRAIALADADETIADAGGFVRHGGWKRRSAIRSLGQVARFRLEPFADDGSAPLAIRWPFLGEAVVRNSGLDDLGRTLAVVAVDCLLEEDWS